VLLNILSTKQSNAYDKVVEKNNLVLDLNVIEPNIGIIFRTLCLFSVGPSGGRALPLAAGINEGGHYFRYFSSSSFLGTVVQNPKFLHGLLKKIIKIL
jgi:hypothetical protein